MTDTSGQTITIQGIQFAAPAPYAEGHVLSQNEAAQLNQVLGENLRNNFASHIKKFRKDAGLEDEGELADDQIATLQSAFNDYAANYEFNGKRQSRAPVDPIARECHKIAKAIIVSKMQEKGMKVKELAEGQMDKFIEALISKDPNIRAEAERRVASIKAGADAALEVLSAA